MQIAFLLIHILLLRSFSFPLEQLLSEQILEAEDRLNKSGAQTEFIFTMYQIEFLVCDNYIRFSIKRLINCCYHFEQVLIAFHHLSLSICKFSSLRSNF